MLLVKMCIMAYIQIFVRIYCNTANNIIICILEHIANDFGIFRFGNVKRISDLISNKNYKWRNPKRYTVSWLTSDRFLHFQIWKLQLWTENTRTVALLSNFIFHGLHIIKVVANFNTIVSKYLSYYYFHILQWALEHTPIPVAYHLQLQLPKMFPA